MEKFKSKTKIKNWEALAALNDLPQDNIGIHMKLATSCIESVNEFCGFAVNTRFSNPKSSVFITRTYSSNVATFIPILFSAAST